VKSDIFTRTKINNFFYCWYKECKENCRTTEREMWLLTLVITPSSWTVLLIFLNSSYNASTSLMLTALIPKQVNDIQELTKTIAGTIALLRSKIWMNCYFLRRNMAMIVTYKLFLLQLLLGFLNHKAAAFASSSTIRYCTKSLWQSKFFSIRLSNTPSCSLVINKLHTCN
jgi:hypothetical protein